MARLGRVDDQVAAVLDAELAMQFADLGATVPPELIERSEFGADVFEVQPANWPAVTAFLACETQWRVAAGLAGLVWIGLDYGAVDVVLRRIGSDAAFADLQVMEDAALDVFSEDRS